MLTRDLFAVANFLVCICLIETTWVAVNLCSLAAGRSTWGPATLGPATFRAGRPATFGPATFESI